MSTLAFAHPLLRFTPCERSKSIFTQDRTGAISPSKRFVFASPNSFTPARASLVTDLLVKSVEAATAAAVTRQFVTPQSASSASTDINELIQSGSPKPVDSPLRARSETIDAVLVPATNELFRTANSFVDSLQSIGGRRKWTKLAVCIVIDLIGSGGLGVPLVSDLLDVITAPLAALALHALFGNPGVTVAGFVEEILPGTDGIPTATLAWLAEHNGYIAAPQSGESTSEDD